MRIYEGKIKKPFVILVHGEPGVGKSTFAKSLEKSIFVGTENTDELDCARADKIESVAQFKDQLDWLQKEKHDFKTLVVDAIDGIEQLMIQEIINSDSSAKKKSINSVHGGYGAGYSILEKEMIDVREMMQKLRDTRGMNICVISHTEKKTTVDPIVGDSYDEYKLALEKKTESVWVDWASAVLMMCNVVEKKTDEKFAFGKGDKVIYTQRRPGILAKNRFDLPVEMAMPKDNPSGPFMKYYNGFFEGRKRTDEEIKASISGLLSNISDADLVDNVNKSIDNGVSLEKIEQKLKTRLGVN